MTTREIYYINHNDLANNSLQLNPVLLNTASSTISSKLFQRQSAIYNQGGNLVGTYFLNQTVQENKKKVNVCNNGTLQLENGSLVFFFSRKFIPLYPGYITETQPVYKSGIYHDKNVKIIREIILSADSSLLLKFTIIY
jgi:hypothetical protein